MKTSPTFDCKGFTFICLACKAGFFKIQEKLAQSFLIVISIKYKQVKICMMKLKLLWKKILDNKTKFYDKEHFINVVNY